MSVTQIVNLQPGRPTDEPGRALRLKLPSVLNLTDEQLFQLCQLNRELLIERSATGELLIMSPTGSQTAGHNAGLSGQLWFWNRQTCLGKSFDSSTGFRLPNGAVRSPDAAWIHRERWNSLTTEQKQQFAPLCPDFVVELCSPSDTLEDLRMKMQEYLANGARLGWLIDPKTQQVEVYRSHQEVEILVAPGSLSGEDVLPGFELELREIWESP